ncbi:heme-binding protein [Gordonia sp. NPDC057258]|uniref:GlcG/HbpS family heme-binding protein n=1 Tax=unclassified Gordonia (in: high G+C Gram-positive bacteria) TaxID=2657482 RepID=UPI00363CC02E
MTELTLSQAQHIVASAVDEADRIGQPVNIAVVDGGGNLVTHVRQDGAWIGSIEISIDKAWTARAFDLPTSELASNAQLGGQFHGIQVTNGGRVTAFAGGVPLRIDGVDVGAVGVSGGSGEQDQAIALAAADSLEARVS